MPSGNARSDLTRLGTKMQLAVNGVVDLLTTFSTTFLDVRLLTRHLQELFDVSHRMYMQLDPKTPEQEASFRQINCDYFGIMRMLKDDWPADWSLPLTRASTPPRATASMSSRCTRSASLRMSKPRGRGDATEISDCSTNSDAQGVGPSFD